jgi:2-haloacid dehalogenase/putative hydrolase of the HAD superfamily
MRAASDKEHLLTFDCYGTLIDWEAGIASAFEREAAKDGRRLDRAALFAAYAECEAEVEAGSYAPYREVLAAAARCTGLALGWDLPRERAAFLATSLPSWKPFPDTNPSLKRLAASCAMGILSNVDDDLLEETRRYFPIEWDLIVTAEQVGSYKPAHAHWIEARRRMEGRHGRWTHVAQSYYHDVVPALDLGLPVVWVNRRGERLEPTQRRPTEEVRTLAEAADLILGVE